MGLPLFGVDIRYLMARNKLANCLSQSVVGRLKMDLWYPAVIQWLIFMAASAQEGLRPFFLACYVWA